jgi:rubrerythrin
MDSGQDDNFDRQFIYCLTLKCADCGLIFRKEHQHVCPVCSSRNVANLSTEEFQTYYSENSD